MKALKTILIAILAIAAAVLFIWRKELMTLATVERINGNEYLYQMTYKADYDLDEVIAAGIDENQKLLDYVVSKVAKGLPLNLSKSKDHADEGEHCTSFQVKNADGDGYIFGRNYDYFKNPSLLTFSYPKNGYASVAMSDMSHFGYGLDKLPDSFLSKALCLASIYAPVDGMNEKGLCTSIMALPKQPSQQETEKPNVGTTILMRLFLDRCATVEEAIALTQSVDVKHDVKAGSGYHYMVADAVGNCAVIEFDLEDGWRTMVTQKQADSTWMHVTNHLLHPKYNTGEQNPKYGNPHSKSWLRYEKVAEYMAAHSGILTLDEAAECLSLVHWKDLVWDNGMVEDTQYSAVYDQSALTISLREWNRYDDEPVTLSLK